VRLIAADVYRPAAIDQLETLGKDLQVPVFADTTITPDLSRASHRLRMKS
jgi:signal recognition particle subunit SRP54